MASFADRRWHHRPDRSSSRSTGRVIRSTSAGTSPGSTGPTRSQGMGRLGEGVGRQRRPRSALPTERRRGAVRPRCRRWHGAGRRQVQRRQRRRSAQHRHGCCRHRPDGAGVGGTGLDHDQQQPPLPVRSARPRRRGVERRIGARHAGLPVGRLPVPPRACHCGPGRRHPGDRTQRRQGDAGKPRQRVDLQRCHDVAVAGQLHAAPTSTTGSGMFDPTTHAYERDWVPGLGSAYTSGAWALHTDVEGCLWFGGDMLGGPFVNGQRQYLESFSTFCPRDTVAPTVPGAAGASTRTGGGVQITWTPSTDDEPGFLGYEVLRNDRVISPLLYASSYLDPTGTPADRYFVRAVDPAGNRSATSAVLLPSDTTRPTMPGDPRVQHRCRPLGHADLDRIDRRRRCCRLPDHPERGGRARRDWNRDLGDDPGSARGHLPIPGGGIRRRREPVVQDGIGRGDTRRRRRVGAVGADRPGR